MVKDTKHPRYQDYVIKNGKLVGEFEEMYQDFDDPWNQTTRETFASEKAVGINLMKHARHAFGSKKVVELGCGFGDYSQQISEAGFDVTGLDISETAIKKAKKKNQRPSFEVGNISDFDLLKRLNPDIIVMAEITWYVLDDLPSFLEFLKSELPNTLLVHLLVTYPLGVQSYGKDYFTDLDGIKRFFGMTYLESGAVFFDSGEQRTWFLGTWNAEQAGPWTADH